MEIETISKILMGLNVLLNFFIWWYTVGCKPQININKHDIVLGVVANLYNVICFVLFVFELLHLIGLVGVLLSSCLSCLFVRKQSEFGKYRKALSPK